MSDKILLNSKKIQIILQRLACQLIENHGDFSNTVLIGLQPRGTYFAERIASILSNDYQIKNIKLGKLDITFYRDDFRRRDEPISANSTKINFLVENQKVVFIDDVLFSGRSINAALTAIQSYGRPAEVELLVLVDRRFSRHLPIQPDYKGATVDVINEEKVVVNWSSDGLSDSVYITNKNKK
ncbi:bifunctional pyr operon transcriptional regulator/uracil phosphoribosyltransferase PyrR [Wenyingzhuangia sp. 1_MG-2023]|nr:bifunctional pyr operon transcriptional regulator/uracil phosphoribosyltransferase PyrR [Wenyingzhuangia sp. 1_MG-2023]